MKKELKYFIGADVHQSTTTLSVMDCNQKVKDQVCLPTRVPILRSFLEGIKGPKGLVVEEMGLSQWLYTMLKPCVDELIICDPYRNHLLKEGPKTDPIDATKLARLYQGGFLKPVYHSSHRYMQLRNVAHIYQETVRALVRIKNQYKAFARKNGIDPLIVYFGDNFELSVQKKRITFLETQKKQLTHEMERLAKRIPEISLLMSIDGLGIVGSFMIMAAVVDAKRFRSKKAFWSYCGLVKHPRQSGGRTYGYTNIRYHRELKSIFKRAAVIVLATQGDLRNYYDRIIENGLMASAARNALARKIAAISLSCLKHKRRFDPARLH